MPGNLAGDKNEEARHTDDLQDIIKAVPSWIVRWGITVLFIIMVLMIVFASLIKYPDLIKAEVRIMSVQQPSVVKSTVSGKLQRILITDSALVRKGSILGFFDTGKGRIDTLRSPAAGRVRLLPNVHTGLTCLPNQPVFYVMPLTGLFYGQLQIAELNINKVKKGQHVIIKLKSYPAETFGTIAGVITRINDQPFQDSVYLAEVSLELPAGPVIQDRIFLKNGLGGEASILTENTSILQRIFSNLKKSLPGK